MTKNTTTAHTPTADGRACTCGPRLYGHSADARARSFDQHLEAARRVDEARVGDFATYSIGSDRYVVEVVARTAKSFTVRTATAVHAGRTYESGRGTTFVALPDEDGRTWKMTLRGDGAVRTVGCGFDHLVLGQVDDYRDPSF